MRLNGEAAVGKVVLKPDDDAPDGFNILLQRCSAKLGCQIVKLFNTEGFEIDELEVIDAGDTLVAVREGEAFSRGAIQSSVSLSSLSTLTHIPSGGSSICSLGIITGHRY